MSKQTLQRALGILIVFSLLFSDGWAQTPRLKTVERPDSGTIPVTGLEQGLYFLQIKREDGRETIKFVVRQASSDGHAAALARKGPAKRRA